MDRFYEIFISSSDEIKDKFKNTDMEAQKIMLLKSLSYMKMANSDSELLYKTAVRHSKNDLDIQPSLYSVWLNCLIEAVKLTDPNFDTKLEDYWRITMQSGIDYMADRYEH